MQQAGFFGLLVQFSGEFVVAGLRGFAKDSSLLCDAAGTALHNCRAGPSFCIIGAEIISNTILGVPYYDYSITMGPKTLF